MALGEECPEKGRVRGLIVRHMNYWMRQPVFDNGGILTVGYAYPNLNMSEGYNSPGSPYWAFKTFLCLGLKEEDAFWQDQEEGFPKLEKTKLIPESRMLFQHFGQETVALTSGQYTIPVYHTHSPAKYAKFAYSSVFGFSVPRRSETLIEAAPDNMLAFETGEKIYVRKECISFQLSAECVTSTWSPVKGILVETCLIPRGRGHLRRHKVVTEYPCTAYDCGFAYPFAKESECRTDGEEARVQDDNGYSLVRSKQGEAMVIDAVPNTNLVFPLTKIPAVKHMLEQGTYQWETYCEAALKKGIPVAREGDCYELCVE